MLLIADGLLIATCLTAALYCYVLSRRLKQFSNTEDGVGKQVRELNLALDETRNALKEAQLNASGATEALSQEVTKARKLISQLRTLSRESSITPVPAGSAPSVTAVAEQPTKLEAVKHPEPSPSASSEVDDDEDLEEVDLEQVLDAAPGEQQLGFLPDEENAEPTDDAVEQHESSESPEVKATTLAGEDENLLKVERMAL